MLWSQACLKDGNQESRLVLAVKPLKPLTGTPGTLEALVAASTADVDAGAHGEAAAAPAGVPGLALDKVSVAEEAYLHRLASIQPMCLLPVPLAQQKYSLPNTPLLCSA